MVPFVSVGVLVVTLVLTGFFATVSRVSLLILHGLHAYLLPEDSHKTPVDTGAGNGAEKEVEKLKKKGGMKKKERDVFDEAGAQIIRIRLAEAQLETRKYFQEYDESVIYSSLGLTSFVTREIFQLIESSSLAKEHGWIEAFTPDDRITFMVSIFAVYKLLRLLAKVSHDPQLARKSERLLQWIAGILGFVLSSTVLIFVPTSIIDFGIDDAVGDTRRSASLFMQKKGVTVPEEFTISTTTVKLLLATAAGVSSGFLFGPAVRNAKSFWVGTDQLEWNITVLKRSRLARAFLNLGIVLPMMVALLWVKPMGVIFVRPLNRTSSVQIDLIDISKYENLEETSILGPPYESGKWKVETSGYRSGDLRGRGAQGSGFLQEEAIQNVRHVAEEETGVLSSIFMSRQYDWTAGFGVSDIMFGRIQLWSLFITGLLHVFLLRVNLQTYCNGAVLVWYESLHRSKIHNTEVTKAKIFLNNYFVCRIALQSLVPGVLVLLMIGLARTRGSHLDNLVGEGSFFFAPSFVRAVTHFSSWWLVVMPALQTWVTLALFRVGVLTSTA